DEWSDVIMVVEGATVTLHCSEESSVPVRKVEWLTMLNRGETWTNLFSVDVSRARLDGRQMEHQSGRTLEISQNFSLQFTATVQNRGFYSCRMEKEDRTLNERIVLLALIKLTLDPAPVIPIYSTVRLKAEVSPSYAVANGTWLSRTGSPLPTDVSLAGTLLTKLPRVTRSDSDTYTCNISVNVRRRKPVYRFTIRVNVNEKESASFRNITYARPESSLAALSRSAVTLPCSDINGDYVLLYWWRVGSLKSDPQLIFQFDRWRDSRKQSNPRLRLHKRSPLAPGNFSFLLRPELKDAGSYRCEVFRDDQVFAQATALTVLNGYNTSYSSTMELTCEYSTPSGVPSLKWSHLQKPDRPLPLTAVPGQKILTLDLPITPDTAGQYACTLMLQNGQTVRYLYTAMSPSTEPPCCVTKLPDKLTTDSAVPLLQPTDGSVLLLPLSILLFLVPMIAVAVGVLLWRRGPCTFPRNVERSLSYYSGEVENIYENPQDLIQAPPENAVYMDLKLTGETDVYRELDRCRLRNDGCLVMVPLPVRAQSAPDPSLTGPRQTRGQNRKEGYICSSKLIPVSQYIGTVLVCLLGVACLRGWGRWRNPEYHQFVTILEETKKNHTSSNKKKLACYDFDFSHWPADFSWREVSNPKLSKAGVSLLKPEPKHRGTADSLLNSVRTLPCHIVSYLVAHSFGRRMLYPGSVGLLQKAMRSMLQQGQAKLIEEYDGQRNKLAACDGNQIDTMFVDRRGNGGPNGKTLVICCEGNAGFYEVGCMNTPLEGEYSVLGWNHPGFAGSTGVPFPQNEANAMDVVIQFAVHKLGFELSDIVVYAWSIGGFTATWAAMSYPEIRALVLDASFDDLLPLALKVMPESWRPLVTHTVRQYMNLNNAEQLCKYQGPVLLIRRTRDEIITTTGPEDIMSNRGNDLLLKLLHYRYPKVMTEDSVRAVREWLAAGSQIEEESVYIGHEVDDDWCLSVLQSYQTDRDAPFPWSVGEDMAQEGRRHLALFL
ncbi:protein ABHD16A, partial [Clarias magur]